MASTDALPIPRKNVAYRAVFPLLDADGDLVTGASALDSEVSKDQGTFADCTNEATEIATASGMYYLDLTSTEMNADCVAVIVKTSTSGAKTTCLVFYPQETGDIKVDVQSLLGTAWLTPGTAGTPDVNVKLINAVATTSVTAVSANVGTTQPLNFTGTAGSALVKGDVVDIAGAAVSTSTAQVGVNVVNNAGSAITSASGVQEVKVQSIAANAITATSINADAITAAKVADGTIDAATFAAGAINAAAIAADAITDAKVAADVTIASVTGAVGSVTGAVGSVTGAVGSVTGNVGGNVVGSVGSVTAGVTVASGGIGSGAHAAAELNAIADAMLDRNMATGTDSGTNSTATRTVRQALRRLRNKESIAAGTLTVTKEDDATSSWTAAVTTTAGNPISAVDPT